MTRSWSVLAECFVGGVASAKEEFVTDLFLVRTVLPTSEREIVGSLTFHKLALIIAGASTIVAIILSFYLIWMHALHYTKPREQKQ